MRLLEKEFFFDTTILENNLEIFSQLEMFIPYNYNNSLSDHSQMYDGKRVMAKDVDCSIVCKNGKNRNNLNIY